MRVIVTAVKQARSRANNVGVDADYRNCGIMLVDPDHRGCTMMIAMILVNLRDAINTHTRDAHLASAILKAEDFVDIMVSTRARCLGPNIRIHDRKADARVITHSRAYAATHRRTYPIIMLKCFTVIYMAEAHWQCL